jgi:hypothetical protein
MSEIEYNDRHTRFFPQPLDYQVAEKLCLQPAQKDSEARRAHFAYG